MQVPQVDDMATGEAKIATAVGIAADDATLAYERMLLISEGRIGLHRPD